MALAKKKKQLKEKAMTNGAGVNIVGQARRRIRERLAHALFRAHWENAERLGLEGRGFKPAPNYTPPGSWDVMAEAAIDIFEIEMGKLMKAVVGDRKACAKGYRAAYDRFAREAVGMFEIGQNGAGSKSLRELGYGTTSRAGELLLTLLAEIANTEGKRDPT
jgi:hypothetical protein